MKKLVLVVSCLVGIDAVAANVSQLPPAVKRTLARQLAEIVVANGLSPLQPIQPSDVPRYADSYSRKLADALAQKPQIIASYAKQVSNFVSDNKRAKRVWFIIIDSFSEADLAVELSRMVNAVAQDYAKLEDGVVFRKRNEPKKMIKVLQVSLQLTGDKATSRIEGEVRLHRLYKHLSDTYQDREKQEEAKAIADDMSEYLRYFPKLDQGLTNEEFEHVLELAQREQVTYREISDRIDKILAQSPDMIFENMQKFDEMQKKVNILDVADFSSSQEFLEDDIQLDFDITFAQLLEKRFLTGVTAQFLMAMDWTWHEFSTILYPQDNEQAALFVADYRHRILDEGTLNNVQTALQKKRDELSESRKAATINNFLTELPNLVAKEKFIKMMEMLAEKTDAQITNIENHQLLKTSYDDYNIDMLRWQYLPTQLLVTTITLIEVIAMLTQTGVTDQQLIDYVFTPQVFNKLVLGKIVNEQDLNAMRMLVNEENFTALKAKITGGSGHLQGEQLAAMIKVYYNMPLVVQSDGFFKKIASGASSNQNLLKALETVEKDSTYHPLAVKLLHDLNSMSKKKRTSMLSKIRKNINNAQKQGIVVFKLRGLERIQASNIQESALNRQEQPVELINPAVIHQQKKQLRKLQRKAKRALQPAKIATPQVTEEQRREEAQREAELKSERELRKKITKLSRMIGKTSLPADTPTWLRLRAIISYVGTDVQQLSQRADLIDMQERFFALVAQDATVMPTSEELTHIILAVQKHVGKRKDMLKPEKSRILDDVYAEMAELERIIEAGGML